MRTSCPAAAIKLANKLSGLSRFCAHEQVSNCTLDCTRLLFGKEVLIYLNLTGFSSFANTIDGSGIGKSAWASWCSSLAFSEELSAVSVLG